MFRKFKINKIFQKIKTEKVIGKAADFPQHPTDDYCVPLLTAAVTNQGLSRYARKDQCKTILKNVLSVSANGNAGVVFYQSDEFAVLQDAYAIKLKDKEIENEAEGLYLATALNKAISENHDWANKAGWAKIENDYIWLPAIKKFIPDWDEISCIQIGGVLIW